MMTEDGMVWILRHVSDGMDYLIEAFTGIPRPDFGERIAEFRWETKTANEIFGHASTQTVASFLFLTGVFPSWL